jgi:mevalonate kinase
MNQTTSGNRSDEPTGGNRLNNRRNANAALGHASRRGYGETWAKTILMGEHSVVYGYPAVAVPIHSLKMRAWASPTGINGRNTLRALGYYGSFENAPQQFGGLLKAVDVARDFAHQPVQGFDIVTRSDFPAGRGLGSSAAASGAVIRAVLDALGTKASHDDVIKLTNQAEVVTHGNPSGLDTVTTCGADPVLFVKGDMQHVSVHLPAYLVIADSGVAGSTKEAVEDVHAQYDVDYVHIHAILERLGTLATDATRDLEEGGLGSLGKRMNAAHALLEDLHVSHPIANALVRQARLSGALGAKMTGGGLGGCVLALATDVVSARHIKRDLLANGAPAVWIHPLNQLDVEVEGNVENVRENADVSSRVRDRRSAERDKHTRPEDSMLSGVRLGDVSDAGPYGFVGELDSSGSAYRL